jgi:deoxycytidylate deaminase
VMYCTHAPCLDCAKTISISPVATVCFSDIWENKIEGIKLLVNAGKTVIQYHDECPF